MAGIGIFTAGSNKLWRSLNLSLILKALLVDSTLFGAWTEFLDRHPVQPNILIAIQDMMLELSPIKLLLLLLLPFPVLAHILN